MLTYEELARACFDNDAQVDEGFNSFSIIERLGEDPEVVKAIAEQRALRLVIALRGPDEIQRMKTNAYAGTFSVEDLTEREQDQVRFFTAVWMDGFSTLLRVAQ